MTLVLASASAIRAQLLRNAGLHFQVAPSRVDESEVHLSGRTPADIAQALAHAKALHVAREFPMALVIGADQVMEADGRLITKARTTPDARARLRALRGKTHTLISAVCAARDGEILWSHNGAARMHMRNLDDSAIEAYMHKAGAGLTRAVGGYEIESHGAWLFEEIEGDYFTVLGLPLLPLLGFLATQGYGP